MKLENDTALSMLSTDIAGDSDLPGDKAHEVLELLYVPASEFALLIAVFNVNRFKTEEEESPFKFATLESEVPLLALLGVVVASLLATSRSAFFDVNFFPASESNSREFLECLREEKDLAFSSNDNLPGAMLLLL